MDRFRSRHSLHALALDPYHRIIYGGHWNEGVRALAVPD